MKLSSLTPNAKNPRTVTDAKLSQLKKNIEKLGDISGVVFNRKSKQLVCGHQRIKSVDDVDITITKKYSKPTKTGTVAEGFFIANGEKFSYRETWWDSTTEKAANIAANKGAGEWDLPQLGEWLKELNEFDLDFDMGLTMFDDEEIKNLGLPITVGEHTRTGKTGVDEDEIPEKAPARSQIGDLYLLGEHRLLCGDSTKASSVERLMKGQKADMVLTDPPYNHASEDKNVAASVSQCHRRLKNAEWDKNFDIIPALDSIDLVKAENCTVYIFTSCHLAGKIWEWSKTAKQSSWCCWVKPNPMPSLMKRHWTWDHEMVCYSTYGKHVFNFPDAGHAPSTWSFQKNAKNDLHPTMKPVEVLEHAIIHSSNGGQLIVDLFGGSGSTLIACEKTHRKCFMMEIDPHYCDVIVERWCRYTGLEAKLVRTDTKIKPSSMAKAKANGESKSKAATAS